MSDIKGEKLLRGGLALPTPTQPPAIILQTRIEEKLVEKLLQKALTRLEDIMDTAEDDALVQKTATYIIDLAKEMAGFRKGGDKTPSSGVNIAIFPPKYLANMASEAQKVLGGEIIEVEVEETA